MGLGHKGLSDLAKASKVNPDKLGDKDLLMFLNKAGDKLKILGAQGKVLGYLKMPSNRPIMREALSYIPLTFGADGFDYESACKMALEKRFPTKPRGI